MVLPEEGKLLRIFIGELDTHKGQPLYQWLVEEARRNGLAGLRKHPVFSLIYISSPSLQG